MMESRITEDPEECRRVWEKTWPVFCLFDLWDVRACFADGYGRSPSFVVVEESGDIHGVMALSWIDEAGYFGSFPGETWHGKTWLEQNRIPCCSHEAMETLQENIPGPVWLRYLVGETSGVSSWNLTEDETGYLFHPGDYGFSFCGYMQEFSGKSRKKLGRELAGLETHGVSYRYNSPGDIDRMFRMNLEAFGQWSYFREPRFLNSFERLAVWLGRRGLLRVTTLLLGGEIAAIDIGAVWNKTYTVLAGGTNPEFPGVAKMINFHHIRRACEERLVQVDFLCGDFGWKQRFHLRPRPLYEMRLQKQGEMPWNIANSVERACGI